MKKVLVLCTGNSCRSQIAEGIFNSFPNIQAHSAGTKPAEVVHPKAITVMAEIGIDISGNVPKHVDLFTGEHFDLVLTVCGNAEDNCPVFTGSVKKRLHIPFYDPALAQGNEEEVLHVFRTVRNEIQQQMTALVKEL